MIPQIIYVILISMGLGIELAKHGKERNDKYHAGWRLLSIIIHSTILYFGGFFNILIK